MQTVVFQNLLNNLLSHLACTLHLPIFMDCYAPGLTHNFKGIAGPLASKIGIALAKRKSWGGSGPFCRRDKICEAPLNECLNHEASHPWGDYLIFQQSAPWAMGQECALCLGWACHRRLQLRTRYHPRPKHRHHLQMTYHDSCRSPLSSPRQHCCQVLLALQQTRLCRHHLARRLHVDTSGTRVYMNVYFGRHCAYAAI